MEAFKVYVNTDSMNFWSECRINGTVVFVAERVEALESVV